MEPASIAVLAFTAAFLGLCIWIERNSRLRQGTPGPGEPERQPYQPKKSRRYVNYRAAGSGYGVEE